MSKKWRARRKGAGLFLFLAGWGLVLAGCDSTGPSNSPLSRDPGLQAPEPAPSGSPAPSPTPSPSPSPTSTPPPGLVSASCVSNDPSFLCIGVKLVSYVDSSGTPALSQAQAVQTIGGVNAIWQPCGIGFQIEEYDAVDPTAYGLQYGSGSQNELDQIRQRFSNSSTFLVAVTGAWTGSYIAWTTMPGVGPYGSVLDARYASHPVTMGHELGHYMGLDHDPNLGNVMYAIAYDTDTSVNQAQCTQAQQTDQAYWPNMLRR
jgi:hypothetical protein